MSAFQSAVEHLLSVMLCMFAGSPANVVGLKTISLQTLLFIIMQPAVQQDIKTLFQVMSSANDTLNLNNKKAVLVMGIRECGKTTLSYHLSGHQVNTSMVNGKYTYKPEQQYKTARVGNKQEVYETPNEFEYEEDGERVSVIDLPNLELSKNVITSCCNNYFLHRIIEQFESIKILIVMTAASLKNSKASIYIGIVTQLFNLFRDSSTPLKLGGSVGLVFNKAPVDFTIQQVRERLEKKIESQLPIQRFSEMLLKTNNLAIVRVAGTQVEETPKETLHSLLNRMQYWQSTVEHFRLQRLFDHLDEDGKEIKDNIEAKIVSETANICMHISNAISIYSRQGNPDGWVIRGQADIVEDPTADWYTFFMDTYGYAAHRRISKSVELKSTLPSLEFIVRVCELGIPPSDECDQVTWYAESLLSLIYGLVARGNYNVSFVENMHYLLVQRMNMKRILHLPDKISYLAQKQYLINWAQLKQEEYQQKFIRSHKIKEGQPDTYYDECRVLLHQYKDRGKKNLELYRKLAEVEQLNSRECEKRDELHRVCCMLLKSTKYMAVVQPTVINGDRYEKVANILLKLELYPVALQLFKALNDMRMVVHCYDQMYKLSREYERLADKAQYLYRRLRFQMALDAYQEAERLARVDPIRRQQIRKAKEDMVRKRHEWEMRYLQVSQDGGLERLEIPQDRLVDMIEKAQKTGQRRPISK